MLRALTSYFFGGIEDETPEAPIECETREVNDWLVVNLPDQNTDSINLNEDDDMYEIDDEDIRDEMDEDIGDEMDGNIKDDTEGYITDDMIEDIWNEIFGKDVVKVHPMNVNESNVYEMDSDSETDEDDVLMSVSFLMMPPDDEKLSNDQYSYEKRVSEWNLNLPKFLPPSKLFSFPYDRQLMLEAKRDCSDIALSRNSDIRILIQNGPEFITCSKQLLELVTGSKIPKQKQRNEIVIEFEGVRTSYTCDLTTYSKNYVNHRHPEKLLNHGNRRQSEFEEELYELAIFKGILDRIKELEPQQQSAQRSAKKLLTRGQLNRQNKNYMYETSSKKNRRSNRQRNPSGANNNRKC